MRSDLIDMVGKYGRWTVIEYSHKNKYRMIYWKCQCECGTIKNVRGANLRSGESKSCGCLEKELRIKRLKSYKQEKNKNWKGGKNIHHGYVEISIGNGKYKLEHRIVAEKAIGRELKKNEIVHHINGNKIDNRNCNLLICDWHYHAWLHNKMSQLYMKEMFGGLIWKL